MPDHLTGKRLSALLDDDSPTEAERRHLEDCDACESELRRLRRMRMALSALDDLEAPADGWARIEAALPDRATDPGADAAGGGGDGAASRRSDIGWSPGGAWIRAAAAVVLFAGGLALGTHLSSPPAGTGARAGADGQDPASPDRVASGEAPVERPGSPGGTGSQAGSERAAASTSGSASLEGLADGSPPVEAYRDPSAAAERLARLDAMMQAAREAMREDPSDPAVNDLLFRVAEDRQALIDALHLATLEYR